MANTPTSKAFLANVPWCMGDINKFYSTKSDLFTQLSNNLIYGTIFENLYEVKGGFIDLPIEYDLVKTNCNYVCYSNVNNEWYYNYIIDIEWLSIGATRIHYSIDNWSTYIYDASITNGQVLTSTSTSVSRSAPQSFEYTHKVERIKSRQLFGSNYNLYFYMNKACFRIGDMATDGDFSGIWGYNVSNFQSNQMIIMVNDNSSLQALFKFCILTHNTTEMPDLTLINKVYALPNSLFSGVQLEQITRTIEGTTYSGYLVKPNQSFIEHTRTIDFTSSELPLLHSPMSTISINCGVQSINIPIDEIDLGMGGDSFTATERLSLSPTPSLSVSVPRLESNSKPIFTYTEFDTIPITIDSYASWQQQQGVTASAHLVTSIMGSLAGGIVLGLVTGGVGAAAGATAGAGMAMGIKAGAMTAVGAVSSNIDYAAKRTSASNAPNMLLAGSSNVLGSVGKDGLYYMFITMDSRDRRRYLQFALNNGFNNNCVYDAMKALLTPQQSIYSSDIINLSYLRCLTLVKGTIPQSAKIEIQNSLSDGVRCYDSISKFGKLYYNITI